MEQELCSRPGLLSQDQDHACLLVIDPPILVLEPEFLFKSSEQIRSVTKIPRHSMPYWLTLCEPADNIVSTSTMGGLAGMDNESKKFAIGRSRPRGRWHHLSSSD